MQAIQLEEIFRIEDESLLRYYRKRRLCIIRGFMQYVWDANGVKYLDCNTCYGAAFLGHSNPKIVIAVMEQLNKIIAVPMTLYNDARAEFLRCFRRLLPKRLSRVVIQNSGTEAVEAALKIARKATRRAKFLSFIGSFHGRTFGSLSVTGNERYRKPFEPLLPHVVFGRFNVTHELDKLVTEDLAAVIVEPIQGEGGVNVASQDFMKELRRLCDERNVLLIIDEIQTGLGRTGYLWAHEHYGIEPDILVAGKALGGGFPIGVTVVKRELDDVLEPGDHGSTFGGNPLVMSAAAAACKLIVEENVPQIVRDKSRELWKRLEELTQSRYVLRLKGMGFMIGIELRREAEPFVDKLLQHNIIALSSGVTTLRLLPPYVITSEDVEMLVRGLIEVLEVRR